jgi:predicted TIM-barrel fold metal-dependent hydrolase
MIIDVHAHYGHDYVFDEDNDGETLLYWCERYGIDHAVVQPSVPRPYPEDTSAIHNEIYALCEKHGGRFFGMAAISPHFKPEDYDKELTRCVKELGFVGVKITPVGHAAHPALQSCMHVYEICAGLDIPVMIHMDGNGSFSHPFNILEPAKSFPRVKFVMAHAGGSASFAAALYAAKLCPNIYLEPSWLDIYSLKSSLETLGPERIMFSSDMPMNIPVELAKYRALTEDASVLAQLFSKTSMHVFNFKIK